MAQLILEEAGFSRGYCLDYGAGEGHLAEALAAQSNLRILGVEEDEAAVQRGRARLHEADAYGPRITLRQADLTALPMRDYAARLIVSSRLLEGGACPGEARELYRMLRPDGGVALLGAPVGLEAEALTRWLDAADLDYRLLEDAAKGVWAVLRRGPLPGAGTWTHMWADIGNTACSGDTRTQDTWEVLWFGEPGPRVMVDRHWEPVAPLYNQGRLFVPAFDRIVCVDAYNGARLWDFPAPRSARIAMMRDAGFLALDEDFLYMAAENGCTKIAVESGEVAACFEVTDPACDWGYIAVDGDQLLCSEQQKGASYLAATTGPGREGNQLGRGDYRLLITSRAILAREKATGAVQWRYAPDQAVIANPTLCADSAAIYAYESENPQCVEDEDGKVRMALFTRKESEYLIKLDRKSGKLQWRVQQEMACDHVFHLSLSQGVLLASGCTTQQGNFWYHLRAFSTEDGRLIWERDEDSTFEDKDKDHGKQDKHPLIVGNRVVLKQGSFDLKTGAPLGKAFSTSNCADCAASMTHLYTRNNSVATCINLDKGGAGAPLCSVLRPGCYISIIPAGGVVMLPAFSAGCTCSHSIQTSIAWLPVARP